eukprot:Rhum_TRINITY_DN23660_c0_g1::Rhum_TRINITY_DN23660_c0_g1_i1::g.178507::m.178507/K12826/SF3A2, SAP62; splicing factor 3A subunit 2
MSARQMKQKEAAYTQDELDADKYFHKNALGRIECKLCSTAHTTEASYKAHTQGKRHQLNLARRDELAKKPQVALIAPKRVALIKTVKIGRPGYQLTKKRDPTTGQRTLSFQVHYPEIQEGITPQYRIMSAYEQKKEEPDSRFQYLLFAAEPYETVAFKIPSDEIQQDDTFFTTWDKEKLLYTLEFSFKQQQQQR